jgi:uncharacterized protein
LKTYNLRGMVLDVDDTLVPMTTGLVSQALLEWIQQIRSEVPLWLVSNNLSETRISRIATSLNLPYTLGARKPSRRKLRQAVETMQIPVNQVAMVGDRLFTDVLAGNRLGMFTILVEPMVHSAQEAPRHYPVRTAEIWISRRLGVTFSGD